MFKIKDWLMGMNANRYDRILENDLWQNRKMARKWVYKRRIWTIIRPKRSKIRRGLENRGFRVQRGLQIAVIAENGIVKTAIFEPNLCQNPALVKTRQDGIAYSHV